MQAVKKNLLVFGQAFNIDSDTAAGIGDPTFLMLLPGKAAMNGRKPSPCTKPLILIFKCALLILKPFVKGINRVFNCHLNSRRYIISCFYSIIY